MFISFNKSLALGIFSCLLILIFCSSASFALEFPESWTVNSTYSSVVTHAKPVTITWKYTAQAIDSAIHIEAHEVNDSLSSYTEMNFNSGGKLKTATVIHQIMGAEKKISHEFSTDAPAIFADSLAPADWLNMSSQQIRSLPQTLKARSQHTEHLAISHTFRVTQKEMTIAQALELEMISSDLANTLEEPLTLFSVLDQKHDSAEILRQLWAPDDFWWVYESTETRTSKRLAP